MELAEKMRLAARARPPRSPHIIQQRWESLLFLHWPCDPPLLAKTLPEGLTLDTFEGKAYFGIIPLFVRSIRPAYAPPVPLLSNFPEINVRTYVHDQSGIPGIWFYALECPQPFAVWMARLLFGLPYRHAAMSAARGDWVSFSSRRSGAKESARYSYRRSGDGKTAEPASLEFFLLERYYLYTERRGKLFRVQVIHQPYLYQAAEVADWSLVPARLCGLAGPDGPPEHSCFVESLDVATYGLEAADEVRAPF